MRSGFNTDVQVGTHLFHVQTEDRGPSCWLIDTAIYQNGRVLHRRSSNYQHFAASAEFSPEELRERVEEQHRAAIEDLRAGDLDAEIAVAIRQAQIAAGIQVKLRNDKSWLSNGTVSLDLEVVRRADLQPEPAARVDVVIEGATEQVCHSGISDNQGRARIEFPLPALGDRELALVVTARTEKSTDQIRFSVRARQKTPGVGPAA